MKINIIKIDNILNDTNDDVENLLINVKELTNRINKHDEKIESLGKEPQDIEETVKSATSECLEEYNIIIDELNDKIAKQDGTIKRLQDCCNNVVKQHAEVINKLSLAVYNIDENVYSQIFKDEQQELPSSER